MNVKLLTGNIRVQVQVAYDNWCFHFMLFCCFRCTKRDMDFGLVDCLINLLDVYVCGCPHDFGCLNRVACWQGVHDFVFVLISNIEIV